MSEKLDLKTLNKELESKSPQERIQWAIDRYAPNIATTSSFGADASVMLHLTNSVYPGIRVFFLETGFHFKETLEFRDSMIEKYNLNIINLTCEMGHEKFLEQYGPLHQSDAEKCCYINKVKPLEEALSKVGAWFSGIRRSQSKTRAEIKYVEEYMTDIYKFNPIADWDKEDVAQYIQANNLPVHPLKEKGFLSIGCQPCTRAVKPGEDPRAGRWDSSDKTECGIHIRKQNP